VGECRNISSSPKATSVFHPSNLLKSVRVYYSQAAAGVEMGDRSVSYEGRLSATGFSRDKGVSAAGIFIN